MKNKFIKPKRKSIGYAYVGMWSDGKMGWGMPTHVCCVGDKYPDLAECRDWNVGEWSYKCKITIEVLKGKNGKPIRRKIK